MSALLDQCKADPDLFSRSVLQRKSTRDQRRFAAACNTARRVQCVSGNGTGKTHRAGAKIVEMALQNPGSRTIITSASFDQAYAGLWQDVVRAFESSKVTLPGEMLDREWRLATGWEVFVANPQKFSSVHGMRGHGGPTFVWVDEAQAVEEDQYWTALESICQDPSSFMCAMGNPLWPQGRFYSNTTDASWKTVWLSCFSHPNVGGMPRPITPGEPYSGITEEWAKAGKQIIPNAVSRIWIWERLIQWGADDPNFVARVLSQFPDSGEMQLFPLRYLNASATAVTGVDEAPRAGFDPARNPGSGDQNAVVVFDATRRIVHAERWHSDDTMRAKDKYVDICKRFNVPSKRAMVDVVGIGAGIVDQSKRDGYPLVPVNFGSAPNGGWRDLLGREALHQNLKAELFDAARHLFRRGLISIPADYKYKPVRDDLVEIRREPGPVMKIEDKDKTRKRIGRSPDYADAVAVALWQESFRSPTDDELRAFTRRKG